MIESIRQIINKQDSTAYINYEPTFTKKKFYMKKENVLDIV